MALFAGVMAMTNNASATGISVGDILVASGGGILSPGTILDINPTLGTQTVISSGGDLYQPIGLCLDPQGNIIVADFGGTQTDTGGNIVSINPVNGQQRVLATGGELTHPQSVCIDQNGNVIVTQQGVSPGPGAVLGIDRTTGAQTIISWGGLITTGGHSALDAQGRLYICQSLHNEVISVDTATRDQANVASGGLLNGDSSQVCLDPTGEQLLITGGASKVISLDLESGVQTLISSQGQINSPVGIADDFAGNAIVMNSLTGLILRVNLATGSQSVIYPAGLIQRPSAFAFVVPEPASGTLLMTGAFVVLKRRSRIRRV